MKKTMLILIGVIVVVNLFGCAIEKSTINEAQKENITDYSKTDVTEHKEKDIEKKLDESKNLLDSMNAEEKREINIFLSNFSEALYDGDGSAANKVSFAYNHNLLNNSNFESYFEYDDGQYMGISKELADKTIERFFGETVDANDVLDGFWFYRDGKYMFPAADGESYSYFTIATNVEMLSNGNYNVKFNVYYDSENAYDTIPKERYSFSVNQAESNCEYSYSGVATIKPKTHNGSETYELVSYAREY